MALAAALLPGGPAAGQSVPLGTDAPATLDSNPLPGSSLRGSTVSNSGGAATTGEAASGTGLATRTPSSRSGSTIASGATSGANNRNPTSFLRQRAAPPRRFGSATTRITRAITQVTPYDLRLTPVVRTPVVGVPLATTLPLAGLQTPGFLLGSIFRPPLAVDDAYAPLGIKVGTFTFLPAIQQSIGYDTNPDQITRRLAKPSVALRTEGELAFRSDWSASELSGELRGGYLDFPDNQGASRPNGAGTTRLRIDANRDTRIDVEGRFLLETQRAGTPDLASTVTTRPLIASYGTTVGVTESFNRLKVSVRGLLDRSEYEDAQLTNGTILRQSDRNLNQYGLNLRAGYELTPDITPFVDVLADTRIYDLRVDSTGIRRDSDGITVGAGATFALTRFVSGEVSLGLQHRNYVDPTLRDLTAPVVNASVIWAASPLTSVRLNATTGIVETSIVGSSGVFTQAATLEVQHDLLRNLSLIGGIGYLSSDYDRVNITERGFSATARFDYRFNRWLALRGSYIYQRIDSSVQGSSFQSNTFLLGLRVNP
ncbi:outer membrane beta-barrel protein [Methylobacterium sp. BTF04]|uniref:outer membrane beta-barrel protein n=1 Tax=Methylobacterium sp. BTF04 TaxID=2708300 RepID=UPI0032B22F26